MTKAFRLNVTIVNSENVQMQEIKFSVKKKALVDPNDSCGKFVYSPLKRIPVKQLNFVGSLADEDLYIESAGDRAEKEEEEKKAVKTNGSETSKNPSEGIAVTE